MGSWGYGSFENDDALDWAGELAAGDGWDPLVQALADVEDGEPAALVCTRAVAAAELVAAGRGHPTKDLPESVYGWLADAASPTAELAARAVAALERIRSSSELRALFQEAGGLRSWSAEIRRLTTRLGKVPRPLRFDRMEPAPEAVYKRAARQIVGERWADAIVTLSAILESGPEPDWIVLTYNDRAWCLAQLGKFEDASADVEHAITLLGRTEVPNTTKAACHGTRGFIRVRTGRHREAIEDLSLALDLAGGRIDFELRAEAWEALGRVEEAAKDRESARAARVSELLQQASASWNDQRHREARAQLNGVLEIDPDNRRALFRRAIVLWELGALREAERDLSRAIELGPGDRYLHYRRSEVRALLGDTDAARADRERCHELGLDVVAGFDDLVRRNGLEVRAGNPRRVKRLVIPELTHVLKLVPEHAGARKLRARAYDLLGDARKAARDRELLQKVRPLPRPAPPPDQQEFGAWFFDLMDSE